MPPIRRKPGAYPNISLASPSARNSEGCLGAAKEAMMVSTPIRFLAAAFALFAALPAAADDAQIQRGKYLVIVSGCSDCHTPGALIGKPDASRYLAGSDVGFAIPGAGIFVGQNLTPDKETGIGDWSADQIVTGIRTGKRPDGSMMSGIMPYPALAHLTDEDAQAIAAFLKSIPA